jgi:hypothetical protein
MFQYFGMHPYCNNVKIKSLDVILLYMAICRSLFIRLNEGYLCTRVKIVLLPAQYWRI